jgi:tetratricopeptide (TPR) repeat protein
MVHRDVKPGNILINDSDNRAMLTDFGLARSNTDQTLTQINVLCGTPAYMSPEQASGNDEPKPTTDIYSLGITLYECLTGTTPFRGQPLQILQQHQEVSPVVPSRLNADAPPDLETICLKAVAKEPSRRYQTAIEMADDLERHVNGRPIQAKPVSAIEIAWLWSKRNRALAAVLFLFVTSLVAGTIVSTTMWFRSERNAHQSRQRLAQLEKGNEILGSIFKDLDNLEIQSKEKPLAAVLAERLVSASAQIDADAVGDPQVVADLQNQLGNSLVSLGHYPEAVVVLTKSHSTRTAVLGPEHPDTLTSAHNLAWAVAHTGKMERARELLVLNCELRTSTLGIDHPDTLDSMWVLGVVEFHRSQFEKSFALFQATFEARKRLFGLEHSKTLDSMSQLANCYGRMGRTDKALELSEQAYALRRKLLGEFHSLTLRSMNDLGIIYSLSGNVDMAITMYQQAVDAQATIIGSDHPETLTTKTNLASAYHSADQMDKAIALYEQTLHLSKEHKGKHHLYTTQLMSYLAWAYYRDGQIDRAVSLNLQALELQTKHQGEHRLPTLETMGRMGVMYKSMGQVDEAMQVLSQAYEPGRRFPRLRKWLVPELIDAYVQSGMKAEAQELFKHTMAETKNAIPKNSLERANWLANYGLPLLKLEMLTEAESILRESLTIRQREAPDVWSTFYTMSQLGGALLGQQRIEEARPLLLDGYEGLKLRADKIPGAYRNPRLLESIDRLIKLAEATDNTDDLAKWKDQRKRYDQEE